MRDFEERLTAAEQNCKTGGNSPNDIIVEINDRSQRSLNLMLFKLTESKHNQADVKKVHDRELISKLLDHLCPGLVNYEFIFFRVGKKVKSNARPIKIVLKSVHEVNQLLGKFAGLDKSALDQGLMDVVLARDRTPYEIKYLSNLREELRTKSENDAIEPALIAQKKVAEEFSLP
ncbi:hypothetical protein J6590_095373 [Homalodisca vitripennis]|nr:hypothetical protein J6590_095373 [Homalodisca vitripennis]